MLHAASWSGPGQRCSSAQSSDVRIAGTRNSSQITLALPNGRRPDNCARAISSSLLGCLSSRAAPRRRVARAARKYLPRTQIVAVDRTVEAAESHGAMRGDASALAALEGRRGEQSYDTFVIAPR